MATPAVPGAINIPNLTGNEVVPLQSGAGSTQTTTQDIANLAGGGGQTGPTGPTGSGATGATGPTGSGGGGGGSSITLTAGTNLAAGTAVAINSSGDAVQTWGPAPNFAGVVTAIPVSALGPLQSSMVALGANNFVAFGNNGNGVGAMMAISRSGTALTLGTLNTSITVALIVPLSSSTFIAVDIGGAAFFCSVSGGVITIGSAAVTSQAPIAGGSLTSSAFVLILANGEAIVGTVAGSTITFGTPETLGSGQFINGSAQLNILTATLFVVTFGDEGNDGEMSAVACTVSTRAITVGSAAAISDSGAQSVSAAAALSASAFAAAWTGSGGVSVAVAGVAGTTVTWGAPEVLSSLGVQWGANTGPLNGGSTAYPPINLLPLSATQVIAVGLGVLPQVCTVSGTSLTVPTPIPLSNNGNGNVTNVLGPAVLSTGVIANSSSAIINSIVATGSDFMVSDGASNVYETDGAGNVSPYIQHAALFNYGLTAADSTHVVGWFNDFTGNFLARVISFEPLNSSGPIGFVASPVTNGNPATVNISGVTGGLTGLTAGAEYFISGDGTLTTLDTGYKAGVAVSTTEILIA